MLLHALYMLRETTAQAFGPCSAGSTHTLYKRRPETGGSLSTIGYYTSSYGVTLWLSLFGAEAASLHSETACLNSIRVLLTGPSSGHALEM